MPKLTYTEVRDFFHYDHATGNLIWRKKVAKKITPGDVAGHRDPVNGYVLIGVNYQLYRAHHLVWFWHHGEWAKQLDHKNTNKMDNRIENLREATSSQNGANQRLNVRNTSGVKGVHFRHGHPYATIRVEGRTIWLGDFNTVAEAAEAYRLAAIKYFGEFARPSGSPEAKADETPFRPIDRKPYERHAPDKMHITNTSGEQGISWDRGRWRVVIKGRHYGRFEDIEQAKLVRDAVWAELMPKKK